MKGTANMEYTDEAETRFGRMADEASRRDVDGVLGARKVGESMANAHAALRRFKDTVSTLFALLRDYRDGTYRDIPWSSIAKIVAALAYLVSPVDAIPDAIPLLGILDDAAVLSLCLKSVGGVLEGYRAWRGRQRG